MPDRPCQAVDRLDLRRVYAHKLTGPKLKQPTSRRKGRALRYRSNPLRVVTMRLVMTNDREWLVDVSRHPLRDPIEPPTTAGSFMRINR